MVSAKLEQHWYALKMKMGWAQPPVMLGEIMAPIGPPPTVTPNTTGSSTVSPTPQPANP
jgi:hypothetical protein